MLVLAILVSLTSQTQLTPLWIVWVWLACLYASVNHLASFHAIWAASCLFGQLSSCPASLCSFHVVWAACKPFSQLPRRLASFQTVMQASPENELFPSKDRFSRIATPVTARYLGRTTVLCVKCLARTVFG